MGSTLTASFWTGNIETHTKNMLSLYYKIGKAKQTWRPYLEVQDWFFFQDWFFHNQFGCDSFLNVQCKGIHTPATTQLVCSSLRSYTVAMSLLDVSLSNFFLKNFHWVLFSEIQINIKWTWINTKCSCKSLWYIGFCPLLIKLVSDLGVAACRDHKVMWFIVVCYRN